MKLTLASSLFSLAMISSFADLGVHANTPFIAEKSPIDITLFVMSRCPDAIKCESTFSQVFQAEGLPEINPALSYIGSINETETTTTELDLSTTSTTTTTTVVTKVNCKHGPLECAGNTQQLCFREFFPDYKVWVPFVTTMNSWQPRRIGEPVYAREVAERVLGLRQRRVRRFLSREEGDKEEKEKEQEALLEKVDECSEGQRGFELLIRSVQNTIDNGVGTSCTVFIDNKKRCVVDGGEWRECPGGSTIADFVRSIKEAAGKVFRISW
ncbi:hypothetical protein K457DRAFT_30462 [Linnemannia elongata AG-77]|uniref:Thioredoxin-like fold domain-containing protein n=1 Tax=Linnemannia elongata AG-77 TaxID=1314771 RepID=A0A197K5A3_9FUNG|nr:hypothetical protein K457DRAFT_30462 [Linnemannia elongata AG-77]